MPVTNPHFLNSTSTKMDGNMGFRFGEPMTVLSNREKFLHSLELSYTNCVAMRSEHSDVVVIMEKNTGGSFATTRSESIEADALITQKTNTPLLLTTADCIPLSLYDQTTNTIALVHVSRHTYALNLIEKTIDALSRTLQIQPENLVAMIGPHIKKDSYHFPALLPEVSPKLAPYIHIENGRAHIDLLAATIDVLVGQKVRPESIQSSPIDTYQDENYFSHVRSKKQGESEGRLATVLCLKT